MVREKRDLRPVLLKVGFAVALSLGGILLTFFKTRKIKPNKSQPPQPSPDLGGENCDLRSDDEPLQKTPNSRNSAEISREKHEYSTKDTRYINDRDSYLLPEFGELVKECNLTGKYDEPEAEGEITRLRSKVKMLQERESSLEVQLLEYYGLKEQETAVMELQNRLKLNNMEAKLYNLKIESLQANNRRLEAEVADYAKVVTELEAAKAKIKLLRKKLRSEAAQNREQILALQERVMKLQDEEKMAVKNDPELIYKMKELEVEIEDLRKSNIELKRENSELAQKLEYLQLFTTSVLDDEEARMLKNETYHLRQQNEDLTKEIEQLQADRCSDAEELVYLRWINACLRYELRNYQPGPGKTIARDLSKTLSPKSEEKAKQLILEYANREGSSERGINVVDFDSDRWSSSQGSFLTDSGDLDDSSVDKTSTSSKTKVFSKLVRLLRGKDSRRHSQGSPSAFDRRSIDEQRCSKTSSEGLYGHLLDIPRSYPEESKSVKGESSRYSRRNSDDSSFSFYRRIDSIMEDVNDLSPASRLNQDGQRVEKSDLVKYADVLKNTRRTSSFKRRSASYS